MSLALFALVAAATGEGLAYPLTVVLDDATRFAGDVLPYISGTILDATGEAVDLAHVTAAQFVAGTDPDGRVVANGPVDVSELDVGRFHYVPAPTDFTLVDGTVWFSLQLTFPEGRQTAPSDQYGTLTVLAALA